MGTWCLISAINFVFILKVTINLSTMFNPLIYNSMEAHSNKHSMHLPLSLSSLFTQLVAGMVV